MDHNTSLKIVQDSMEKLQHRKDEDLPPLPNELIRGAPGSILSPITPIEVKPSVKDKIPEIKIQKIETDIRKSVGIKKEFSADDAVNSSDLQKALKEWQIKYGTK